ncbi:MAG: nuclear transport factor 2 family protein [Gemmatimonadetes bacterium]|nr:nuclear transport factor 2 family protein [Gemmatimonadota bacterium]
MSACNGPTPASSRAEQAPFDLDATRQFIAKQNARFTQAHLAGDVAVIDSMFAPDAKSFPPGADAVTGLQAIHDFTVEYIKAGLTEFREESTDFYGDNDLVVDAGIYVVTYGPEHVTERGKYLNVWRKLNGTRKIQSNIWNSDAPLPTPQR